MNKTMKKIAVLAVAVTLSSGALFAQQRGNAFPNVRIEQSAGKLLGVVEEVGSNSITFIDMDGKKVTVATTPFTDIQDIEKLENVDPRGKEAREALKKTYLYLNQLRKGHWVDIKAYKTDSGKLVAEYVRVIRFPAGDSGK